MGCRSGEYTNTETEAFRLKEKKMISDRLAPSFENTRRANRVEWQRPIEILEPFTPPGTTVNISAVGILLTTTADVVLSIGAPIAINIPHMEGDHAIRVQASGSLEHSRSDLRVAVTWFERFKACTRRRGCL